MTLSELGNLGELIGGIAVIASFIYLARQIKQNTDTLARAEMNSSYDQWSNFRHLLLENEHLTSAWLKGHENPDNLTAAEAVYYHFLLNEVFHLARMQYERSQQSILKDTDWQILTKPHLETLLQEKGAVEWWAENRHTFHNEFAAEIDDTLREN